MWVINGLFITCTKIFGGWSLIYLYWWFLILKRTYRWPIYSLYDLRSRDPASVHQSVGRSFHPIPLTSCPKNISQKFCVHFVSLPLPIEWNEWINEWMNEMYEILTNSNPFCKKTRLFILTNLWKRKALSISTSNTRFDDDDDDDGDNIEDIEPLKRHGGMERRREGGTDVRMDRQSELQRCVSCI